MYNTDLKIVVFVQEQSESEKAEVKTTVDAAFVETGAVVILLLDPPVFVADALLEEEPVPKAEVESEAEAELEAAAKFRTMISEGLSI